LFIELNDGAVVKYDVGWSAHLRGVAQLVGLIGQLYQRPGFGDRPRRLDRGGAGWYELPDRSERSGRRGLPMVCLVRLEGQDELLSWLAEQFDRAKPDVYRMC
jgi:hypothetical protein